MHTLKPSAESTLSLPSETYIYSIAPCGPAQAASPSNLVTISSDDSLRVLDAHSLQLVHVVGSQMHDDAGVTCLNNLRNPYSNTSHAGYESLVATAGRDGTVKLWDVRSNGEVAIQMREPNGAPILSLTSHIATHTLVAGAELASSQAPVLFWDLRSPNAIKLQYTESHNDDVTELQFHPSRNNVLLSGSTDGLVNIYDTTIADEDDALLQVINHGSIHHAGFLSEDAVYALSHDEVFSIHPTTHPDNPTEEPNAIQFGNLREPLGCEYVIHALQARQGNFLAAGNTTEQKVDIFPIVSDPKWQFDERNAWRLLGGHGEEIVRGIYLDEQSKTVYSCGEDGIVRAWKPEDGDDDMMDESTASLSSPSSAKTPLSKDTKDKKKSKDDKRYKPY